MSLAIPLSIQLHTTYSIWLFGLAVVAAIGFAVWSYRWTAPPASLALRLALIALRSIALTGGIWILGQPNLIIERRKEEPAAVAIALDRSQSLALEQAGSKRMEMVKEFFASPAYRSLLHSCNVQILGFGDTVQILPTDDYAWLADAPDRPATDIGSVLSFIAASTKQNEYQAAFLISDGAVNHGADPARIAKALNIPVWTIGVGTTEISPDAMILTTVVSPVVYQGSRTSINVGYRAVSLKDKTLTVSLRDRGEQIVGQAQVKPAADFEEGECRFEVDVAGAGRLRWTAEISRIEGELTYDNNRHSFYVNALRSRIRLTLMAGAPSNACGDLIRRLNRDEHIQLTTRIARGNGFYEGGWPDEKMLSETDVIFLHQFPARQTDRAAFAHWAAEVVKFKIPLCYFDGERADPSFAKELFERLPVTRIGQPAQLTSAQLLPAQRHAVIAAPDDIDYAAKWGGLPPLQFAPAGWSSKPGAEILAYFQMPAGQRIPGLVVQQLTDYKSAALLARDFWRWGLASPGEEGITEPLLGRLVRWLALKPTDKRVVIKFDKEQFSARENAGFYATVYDENFTLIDGAEVEAQTDLAGKNPIKYILEPAGSGRYIGGFTSWGEGEYRVAVSARYKGNPIGSDTASVIVEAFSIELLDTRLNEDALRKIGVLTGGGYVPIAKADSLLSTLEYPPYNKTITAHYRLWGIWRLLWLIIGCLTLEWFIRMRKGML